MAGEDNQGENPCPLRAGRSLHQAFVRFVNRSRRRVDIIWLNYEGFGMKYKTLLSCQFVDVNTFVGHPWIFRDADSGDRMVVQLKEVFEPTSWSSEGGGPPQRKVVYITIPVFSLRERCMQIVRGHVNQDSLDQLDLPVTLIRDLKMSARPQHPTNQRQQVT
ncbi:von Hippel-Lindau disease tumor suppressor-like [Liolophura sinensis]|uniref:von Hippel-Lindau disease tumor suppressor-like n=1 Tax=Liolophura sinensis TaxID=3198878 RepID=UPI0031581535